MENSFDRAPYNHLMWWLMWKLGTGELLVRAVQAMYKDAVSKVRVGNECSEIHKGSILNTLLFIIVCQAIAAIQDRLLLGAPLC
uniref:Reverse transcriptase domain-containing protein n=1 Tax=Octopus bimaculoides TaxID=37653 RepID=A0A0L8FTG0_OCTBM